MFVALLCSASTLLNAAIFESAPSDFQSRVEIVGVFLQDPRGRILLLHRADDDTQGNRWGIPGGKIKIGESPAVAGVREVLEETAFDIPLERVTYLGKVYIQASDGQFVYHMVSSPFNGNALQVRLEESEHKGFTWIYPHEALDMNLREDEAPCIEWAYPSITKQLFFE